MKLIVGLGNPGENFSRTVHNIGFVIIDKIQKIFNFERLNNQEEVAWVGDYLEEKIILLKPQTLMNKSGESVLLFIKKFNLKIEEILVLQDDITLIPGKIRFKRRSSSGGHNGIKSIISQIGSDHFARIKIGVGNDKTILLDKWVIKKLDDSKWKEISNSQERVFEMIIKWIKKEI